MIRTLSWTELQRSIRLHTAGPGREALQAEAARRQANAAKALEPVKVKKIKAPRLGTTDIEIRVQALNHRANLRSAAGRKEASRLNAISSPRLKSAS